MLTIGEDERILLVNTDDMSAIKSLQTNNAYVVTYGLNSKATLTASSITDNKMVICLQRTILDFKGNEIEPQEFTVSVLGNYDPEVTMLIVAICLISGVPIDTLSKFVF